MPDTWRHSPRSQHFPSGRGRLSLSETPPGRERNKNLKREGENCCALRVCRCSPVLPVTLSCSISLPNPSLSLSLSLRVCICYYHYYYYYCYCYCYHHYNYPVERRRERKRAVERAASAERLSFARCVSCTILELLCWLDRC